MGSKKEKATQAPGFAGAIQPTVEQLTNLFQAEGTQPSPFYSDLQRMYSQTLGTGSFALPDYLTKGLESAATTGFPSLTPLQETEFYKALAPTFPGMIERVRGATKESFGAQGALRSSAYSEAAGKGITEALSNAILNIAQQAYGLEEAAKGRQMEGLTTGITAALAPYGAAQTAGGAAQAISASEYPLLNAMLALVQAGAGQQGKTYAYPGEQISGGMSCCFIFAAGEGEITQRVRYVRDYILVPILGQKLGVGYKKMAKKLVPIMEKYKIIKNLVKLLMTSPMSKFAEWRISGKGGGFVFYPISCFWVALWYKIGR